MNTFQNNEASPVVFLLLPPKDPSQPNHNARQTMTSEMDLYKSQITILLFVVPADSNDTLPS
jgi:hypothetical protein